MSDDYRTGKYGRIKAGENILAYADKWDMEIAADTGHFPTFGSSGWKYSSSGAKGATGTLEGPYDFDDPAEDELAVGSQYSAELYLSTVTGGDARFYTLTLEITSFQVAVDAASGEPIRWTANYQSHGAVTDPS